MRPSLRSRQPQELLAEPRLDDYFKRRDAIGKLLFDIRTALFILRRMERFPFEILGLPVFKQHVWGAFEASLLDSVILRIRVMAMDRRSDEVYLWSFRALVS